MYKSVFKYDLYLFFFLECTISIISHLVFNSAMNYCLTTFHWINTFFFKRSVYQYNCSLSIDLITHFPRTIICWLLLVTGLIYVICMAFKLSWCVFRWGSSSMTWYWIRTWTPTTITSGFTSRWATCWPTSATGSTSSTAKSSTVS